MNMLAEHALAMDSASTVYHEFLLKYKPHLKILYGIVEGKQDPYFYQSALSNDIPSTWQTHLIPSGNKTNVVNALKAFDWSKYNAKRICFFVDRDLSDFVEENKLSEGNIYITDQYSIENELIEFSILRRHLTDIYNLHLLTEKNWEVIEKQFEANLEFFRGNLIPLMCQILAWRRSHLRPCLDNIEMKEIFSFSNGVIALKENVSDTAGVLTYAATATGLHLAKEEDISKICLEFSQKGGAEKFIRGKYLYWFFFEYAKNIHESISQICPNIAKPPKVAVAIGIKNAMVVIGPRIRLTDSLRDFVQKNYRHYIALTDKFGIHHLH